MREFEVLDAVSLAGGGRHNEDALGCCGPFAWVLDGATALSPRGIPAHAWTRSLSAALAAEAPRAGSLAGLAVRAIPRAADGCGWARDADLEPHELVSAAGMLAHAREDGTVELLAFGDCEAAVLFRDGHRERFSHGWLDAADRERRAELVRLVAAHGGDIAAAFEEYKVVVAAPVRALMNTAGGYPALTPDGRGIPLAARFSLEDTERLLLFSDGLAWALDDFAITTPERLLSGRDSLGTTVRRLRVREGADASQRRVPRGKGSDDATGLLLSVRH